MPDGVRVESINLVYGYDRLWCHVRAVEPKRVVPLNRPSSCAVHSTGARAHVISQFVVPQCRDIHSELLTPRPLKDN